VSFTCILHVTPFGKEGKRKRRLSSKVQVRVQCVFVETSWLERGYQHALLQIIGFREKRVNGKL
jgi:hypothetical protein